MSVLERAALEASPLADLHAIASEMTIDGYRRLRKAALIDAILERAGGSVVGVSDGAGADGADGAGGAGGADRDGPQTAPPRARKADLGREQRERERRERREQREQEEQEAKQEDLAPVRGEAAEPVQEAESETAGAPASGVEATRRRRGRRGGRGRSAVREDTVDEAPTEELAQDDAVAEPEARAVDADEVLVEGVVELLPNGSGFVRSTLGETADDDIYISATQVKRCELVSGDRVTGPRRAPRRSERFASLVRVDTINGRPATELADSTRYDELPVGFPSARIQLRSEDPTLALIDWLTPIGRGSRVTITGAARAGKSTLLRRLAQALSADPELALLIALAGVRPEEIGEWSDAASSPAAAVSFAASADAQEQAVELVVDQARRVAARGGHAVVAIDTLDGLHPPSARKLLAAARAIVDGGSLTLIATASRPLGGETTVIALDAARTSAGRFPALDVPASGTIRPELLVGEDGKRAIEQAHAQAQTH